MSAALALQTAVIATLRADAVLAGLVGDAVHDGAPQNAGLPHVALGDFTTLPWDTASEDGEEHRATLLSWSRKGGRREIHEINAALIAALHGADLAVAGHALVDLRVTGADARREADGKTWRGRVRLVAFTEPA
ncbi:DUF3168 domain-containing protein [Lutibaculum baratangense]|uniref:DUF3168 domain-containing protein n=1 Tax=Lutibaculum baratangense AMV1 TaxID=631454 RepID=V4R9B9_9HYPH|nr:DUF3168 domain-containing protein [Lutibaculum baratangense]ESR22796.1 hypothetical protein N177_3933 [Lutibaculum baratangense AMV1]